MDKNVIEQLKIFFKEKIYVYIPLLLYLKIYTYVNIRLETSVQTINIVVLEC